MEQFKAIWEVKAFEDSAEVQGSFSYRLKGFGKMTSYHRMQYRAQLPIVILL